jgi:hypothetical protein
VVVGEQRRGAMTNAFVVIVLAALALIFVLVWVAR